MVEHGAGWQGAVGSTFSGFPGLQHPFSLTKAAAVAAVHRCGKVLQEGKSCHSVLGAAALKWLFSSMISPSSESHWSLLIWCLSLPAIRLHLACQGAISTFFSFWRGKSWRPCSYFWKPLCSVSRLICNVLGDPWNQVSSSLPLNSLSRCALTSPDLLYLMHFDYFRLWIFHVIQGKFLSILYFALCLPKSILVFHVTWLASRYQQS